ncbi:MAG TPA: hypothetical protein VGF99_04910 [Myxococcota bacterium]
MKKISALAASSVVAVLAGCGAGASVTASEPATVGLALMSNTDDDTYVHLTLVSELTGETEERDLWVQGNASIELQLEVDAGEHLIDVESSDEEGGDVTGTATAGFFIDDGEHIDLDISLDALIGVDGDSNDNDDDNDDAEGSVDVDVDAGVDVDAEGSSDDGDGEGSVDAGVDVGVDAEGSSDDGDSEGSVDAEVGVGVSAEGSSDDGDGEGSASLEIGISISASAESDDDNNDNDNDDENDDDGLLDWLF